jgi:hypothetical protein
VKLVFIDDKYKKNMEKIFIVDTLKIELYLSLIIIFYYKNMHETYV